MTARFGAGRTSFRFRALAAAAGLLLAAASGCGRPVKTPPKMESALPPEKAPLVSGKNTRVYHTRECQYARDIPDADLLGYDNPDRAERTGRFPCAVCHPRETFAASDEVLTQEPSPEPRPAR
ncbi:MAG: hypothetical protein KIS92_13565 [Planctomycetota bacterium]|nr:hypothetical protein [Planctomycetota bacterium]